MTALHLIKNLKSKFEKSLQSRNHGFTLVELMVAIAILAIVATIGLSTFSQSQRLGRDTKRKQDLRSIATALELYLNSQNPKTYPVSSNWEYSTAAQPWIGELNTNFINRMPIDPVNTGTTPWVTNGGHVYAYCADSSTCHSDCAGLTEPWYILVARLENTADRETIATQDIRWCDGTLLRNRAGWDADNRIFAITSE